MIHETKFRNSLIEANVNTKKEFSLKFTNELESNQ